ncbi:hypothetical protein MMON_53270 [Mycolicibacterium monacense]|uniref:Uncharacterized protein n=1 Tax=Mycolicibacterium monacense TaxID=85693 RepID=A0AAD1N2E7_MYCMB|nr:hypothetical protein MMON_53270 [Mycolicibacterium monacense]
MVIRRLDGRARRFGIVVIGIGRWRNVARRLRTTISVRIVAICRRAAGGHARECSGAAVLGGRHPDNNPCSFPSRCVGGNAGAIAEWYIAAAYCGDHGCGTSVYCWAAGRV